MTWKIEFGDEFDELAQPVREELLAKAKFIEFTGPETRRPHVDTLNDSEFANMKELRFDADNGVWRVAFAFAFDPERKGILLVAGDKSGVNEKRFYKKLIKKADKRYKKHLKKLETKEKGKDDGTQP